MIDNFSRNHSSLFYIAHDKGECIDFAYEKKKLDDDGRKIIKKITNDIISLNNNNRSIEQNDIEIILNEVKACFYEELIQSLCAILYTPKQQLTQIIYVCLKSISILLKNKFGICEKTKYQLIKSISYSYMKYFDHRHLILDEIFDNMILNGISEREIHKNVASLKDNVNMDNLHTLLIIFYMKKFNINGYQKLVKKLKNF